MKSPLRYCVVPFPEWQFLPTPLFSRESCFFLEGREVGNLLLPLPVLMLSKAMM